ncbi:MAG: hypothetical protein U1F57_11565 [bacterium]
MSCPATSRTQQTQTPQQYSEPTYNLLAGDDTTFVEEETPRVPVLSTPQAPTASVGKFYLRFNRSFQILQAKAVAARQARSA